MQLLDDFLKWIEGIPAWIIGVINIAGSIMILWLLITLGCFILLGDGKPAVKNWGEKWGNWAILCIIVAIGLICLISLARDGVITPDSYK
jgi:Mn2+/Fe2+ NRAMP family transporter